MRAKDALGKHGENLAAEYLQSQGMQLLARNWRCDAGELDIIARDGEVIVVCEVRTRSSDRYGTPLASVTSTKFARLQKLALRWLVENGCRGAHVRIDVIGIIGPRGGAPVLRHIRGAS